MEFYEFVDMMNKSANKQAALLKENLELKEKLKAFKSDLIIDVIRTQNIGGLDPLMLSFEIIIDRKVLEKAAYDKAIKLIRLRSGDEISKADVSQSNIRFVIR